MAHKRPIYAIAHIDMFRTVRILRLWFQGTMLSTLLQFLDHVRRTGVGRVV